MNDFDALTHLAHAIATGGESIVSPRERIGSYEDALDVLNRYAREAAENAHRAYMTASLYGINPLPKHIDMQMSETIKSAAAARCVKNPYDEKEAAE